MELCSRLFDSLDGMVDWGRMDRSVCVVETLHCSPETATTLLLSYQFNSVQLLSRVRLFATP